jgi:hypothetical protein
MGRLRAIAETARRVLKFIVQLLNEYPATL